MSVSTFSNYSYCFNYLKLFNLQTQTKLSAADISLVRAFGLARKKKVFEMSWLGPKLPK